MTYFSPHDSAGLSFVTCASDTEVLSRCLLASPCLAQGKRPLQAFFNARSAAEAFNTALASAPEGAWLVWVHQDVLLPEGWDAQFMAGLARARAHSLSSSSRS